MQPLIVIPARLAATRLPGKPLAQIGNAPMIVHVLRRAQESGLGPVLVACDAEEIASAVREAGGEAILTNPAHPSGSDRIWEAVQKFDPAGTYDVIINLQGDVPTLEPALLKSLLAPLADPAVDISTLATPITRAEEHTNPAVVKAILAQPDGVEHPRALYFTRATAPTGDGPRYHHIGVYAYRRAALQRFVALAPSPLEKREKLEQLRALEHGLRIDAAVVDTVPLGVDTPEDLERARAIIQAS
ncbi:MAG: 3-deoxy-manno-octulosonate cytidylyltransferase [Azospirillum brasilense]|nr:MAG: 3-deoxy-manno-octulosonate cytidylyltransferase [Azospirillum brasilense]